MFAFKNKLRNIVKVKCDEKMREMEEVREEDWLKIWGKIGARLLKLPKWMQKIVLDDINTAITNRIAVMEVIESVYRKNKD